MQVFSLLLCCLSLCQGASFNSETTPAKETAKETSDSTVPLANDSSVNPATPANPTTSANPTTPETDSASAKNDPSLNPDAVAIALEDQVKPVVLVQKNAISKTAKLRPIKDNLDDLFVSDGEEEDGPVILAATSLKSKPLVIKTPAPKTRLVDKVEITPRLPHVETVQKPVTIQKPVTVQLPKFIQKPVPNVAVQVRKSQSVNVQLPRSVQRPVHLQLPKSVVQKCPVQQPVQREKPVFQPINADQALLNAISAPVLMPMARGHPASMVFATNQPRPQVIQRKSIVPMDEVHGMGVDAVYQEPTLLTSRLSGGYARFAYKQ